MRPGYKTSEFWLSLAAVLLGVLTASGAIPSDSIWAKLVGVAVTFLAALGYTAARGLLKSAEVKAALEAAKYGGAPPDPS